MISSLRIGSGLSIRDPLAKASRFCEGEYALYDAVATTQDNELTVHDILLSVAVNSRLDAKGLNSVWKGKWRVEQHLGHLPPTLDLSDPEADIPWDTIIGMFEQFDHIKHAKLAVASKILHKKRPKLVPMMDEVIRRHYEQAYPGFQWSWRCGPLSGQLMHHFRADLLAARPELEAVVEELQVSGHSLTLVRLLEMLIWIETEPRGYYR